jgi:tetratricopeptide (TPR) repeat protein
VGGLKVWQAHPVWGTGPDTFFEAYRPYRDLAYARAAGLGVTQADAHNDFIQMAATQGILGLASYLWILIVFMKVIVQKRSPGTAGFSGALIALGVQNQFNFSAVTTTAWAALFAGLLSGLPENGMGSPRTIVLSARGKTIGKLALGVCGILLWFALYPLRADWAYKNTLDMEARSRYKDALGYAQSAFELQGHNEAYGDELANVYRSIGQGLPDGPAREQALDKAWQVTESLTQEHPHDPDRWNNRGVAAMWMVQLGNREALREMARQSFEKAVAMDPVFVDAWANLAKWEHWAGHPDREIQFWQKVYEIDPSNTMAKQVLSSRSEKNGQ